MRDTEVSVEVARHIISVLSRTKVVLLVDDSGSMNGRIIEPPAAGSAPINLFAPAAVVTRWSEAQKAAVSLLVNMITAVCDMGLDVVFLNRPAVRDVT